MYKSLGARMIKIRTRLSGQHRKRIRARKLRENKRILRRTILAFIGISGIVLIWSGISRWSYLNLTIGNSIMAGIGLLIMSGLLTRSFIKTFS